MFRSAIDQGVREGVRQGLKESGFSKAIKEAMDKAHNVGYWRGIKQVPPSLEKAINKGWSLEQYSKFLNKWIEENEDPSCHKRPTCSP